MNILDFGKFNLDNTLSQNKSLLDNYSNTNNNYSDSNKTNFNDMLDKINSKAKSLEPENKINVSGNKSLSKTTNTKATNTSMTSVSSDKNVSVTGKINNQNNTNNTSNIDSKSNNFTKVSNTDVTVSDSVSVSDCSDIKTAGIQYDTEISGDKTSLVNEDLVSELENLLVEYSDSDEVIDLTELLSFAADVDINSDTAVVTDLFTEEITAADEITSDILVDTEDNQNTDSEKIADTENTDDICVTENIAIDVQDILVKENLDVYSDTVYENNSDSTSELVKDIAETTSVDMNKDLKNTDSREENKSVFVKDSENKQDLKNDKLFTNDDSKSVKTDDTVNYENQDIINLDETVEVSDTVKDLNIKINSNKNNKDTNLDNTKISKKDLEDLKVKIEEVSYSENSNSSEFQSNQQTAQENLIKLSIDGIDNLTKMHKPEVQNINFTKVLNQNNTEELTQKNIVSQIYSKIQDMHKGSKMVMTLNPESLGKVQIEIVNSKTGLMAQMSVTNNAVKDILSKDLDGLRSALNAQGINVDSISVRIDETLNNSGKDDYLEQDKNKDNNQEFSKNKKDEEEKKEKQKVFENLMDNIVKDSIKE